MGVVPRNEDYDHPMSPPARFEHDFFVAIQRGDIPEAQVYAIMALASALDRVADAVAVQPVPVGR